MTPFDQNEEQKLKQEIAALKQEIDRQNLYLAELRHDISRKDFALTIVEKELGKYWAGLQPKQLRFGQLPIYWPQIKIEDRVQKLLEVIVVNPAVMDEINNELHCEIKIGTLGTCYYALSRELLCQLPENHVKEMIASNVAEQVLNELIKYSTS